VSTPDYTPVYDDERAVTARSGIFSLQLLPPRSWLLNERKSLPIHATVLRPLLAWALECWAFGIEEGSKVRAAAGDILSTAGRRHRVRLDGDPVTGRELFWNVSLGRRGTIVILGLRDTFPWKSIFPACHNVWTAGNFLTGHTPAAMRMARAAAADGRRLACCLPASNGIQYIDVVSTPEHAVELLDRARALVPRKPHHE
jgi:hypothetical protein